MKRIYQTGDYQIGQHLPLSSEASHHVGAVLRMQVGESLTLFSGNNLEYAACIASVSKKQVVVRIQSVQEANRESPLSIVLAQAISKGDRMEWVVQKAVELGVSTIVPVISQHCAVKVDKDRLDKKAQQWQAIAIAACEQCGRNTVPSVQAPLKIEEYMQHCLSPLKWVLNPTADKSWRDYDLKVSQISVLIGPEGGLSPAEIALAQRYGFQSVALGPRILRTETAAISVLSLLQAVAGDL